MATGKADTANVNGAERPLEVVIVGAGPAGLLLANYLLEKGGGRFRVRIVEQNEDPRVIAAQPPTRMRYSVFLGPRGIISIKGVEGLLPRVLEVGDLCESTTLYNSKGKVIVELTKESTPKRIREKGDEYCRMLYIDRMELSGALLDALLDRHGSSGLVHVFFSTSCASLDLRARTVNVEPRNVKNADEDKTSAQQPPAPGLGAPERWTYDLLVGADGVNSVVRNALARQSYGFDHSMTTTFSTGRSMKCPLPEKIPPRTFHIYPEVPGCKEMSAFLVPEKEKTRTLMVGLGWHKHKLPTKFLAITEVSEMKAFVKKSFPVIGDIPDEAAAQLLNSKDIIVPRSVKCNRYHDANAGVVLIGDAAHATFPNIGQGCNAALTDVTVLARLLLGETVTHGNKTVENVLTPRSTPPLSASYLRNQIPLILPTYSALQVRDGRALVDLSCALDCFDSSLRKKADFKFLLRDILASVLGPRVSFSPQMAIAAMTTPYADVWDKFRTTLDRLLRANIQIEDEWMKAESVKLLKGEEKKFL